jgi:xyloglucan-specific exo-beta-1,4-glucanase
MVWGHPQDGADLSQWQTSGSSNQQWSVITVGSSGARQSALLPDSNNPGDLDIKFYPNPFVSNFKLEEPDSGEPFEVVFFDMNGRAVETTMHSGSSTALTLGAGLKPGLYVVKVKGKTWAKSIKVFKK